MNTEHRHHHTFILLPAALFAWAGFIKIIDPFSMVPALAFITKLVHAPALPLGDIAILIGAVELAMAVSLLLFPRNLAALLISFSLLSAYTITLVVFLVAYDAPSCGCLGTKIPGPLSNIAGVIRNLGTMLLLAWLARLVWRQQLRSTQSPAQHSIASLTRPRMIAAEGFTLVEMMLVCMVIAILAALAVPAFAKSRTAAKDIRTLGTLHQLSISLDQYIDDHKDHFPFTATPAKPWLGVTLPDLPYPVSYFGGQSATYANLLVPHYFQDRAAIDTPGDYGARSRASASFISPFFLTYGAFAPNAYWSSEKAPDGLTLYRSSTRSQCLYPSNKAALVHFMSGMYNRAASIAANNVLISRFDGSSMSITLPADYQNNLPERPYGCQPIPFVSTHNGLAGRDF